MFKNIRKVAWWLMPLYLIAELALRIWSTGWMWQDKLAAWAGHTSSGLVSWNLVARLDDYLLIVVLLLVIGRLRLHDLGWQRRKLKAGFLTLFGAWVTLQMVITLIALLAGNGIAWHPFWVEFPKLVVIGWLVGHLLGTAVIEDTVYRGFLLPQLFLWLGKRRGRVAIAVFVSQLIFTLSHIPQWIEYGMDTPLLPGIVLLLGLIFTAIFLLTDNLFVVMAFHALHDAPTALLASPVDPHLLMLFIEIAFIIWVWLQRRSAKDRFQLQAVSSYM